MNAFQDAKSGAGLLKNFSARKGPISQLNDLHPMIHVLRKKRDLVKTK